MGSRPLSLQVGADKPCANIFRTYGGASRRFAFGDRRNGLPLMTPTPGCRSRSTRRGRMAVGRRRAGSISTRSRASPCPGSGTLIRAWCARSPSRPRRCIHTSNLYEIPHAKRARRPDLRARRHGRGVLLQLGVRGERDGDQARAPLRPSARRADAPAIIVMEHAWHGRTLATLSATGSRKAQAGFEPLVPGFIRVPYNDERGGAACRRCEPEHRRRAGRSAPGRRRHLRRRSPTTCDSCGACATSATGC